MAFVGQSFIIVGGAGGIGFETSKQLLNEGVDVRFAFLRPYSEYLFIKSNFF